MATCAFNLTAREVLKDQVGCMSTALGVTCAAAVPACYAE